MFESLKKAANLAGAVSTAAIRVADTYSRELANLAKDQLPNPEQLTKLFEKIGADYTPIPVSAFCNHGDSVDPNDYTIDLNIDDIAKALNEGRSARPQLTVYAKYPDTLDRDLLAERLEAALRPLIKSYEQHVAKKRERLRQRQKANEPSFLELIELSVLIVVFPPVLLLLSALSFVEAMKQFPSLVKAQIFGDAESKLSAELEHARTTVKKVVRDITIKPLP